MRQNKGEIIIHTTTPMNYLLCGAMPVISHKRNVEDTYLLNNQSKYIDPKMARSVDFSKFPPVVSMVPKARPRTALTMPVRRKSDFFTTENYTKIKEERGFIQNVQQDLMARDDNQRRKAARIHQEWEEKFNTPYQQRLRRSLQGQKYKQYRKERSRAITAMGPRPLFRALENDDPIQIPVVRVSVSGLEDRIMHCKQIEQREKQLEQTVLESQEQSYEPQQQTQKVLYKELRPANEILERLAETRFFDDASNSRPVGKKSYPNTYKSRVSEQLYDF